MWPGQWWLERRLRQAENRTTSPEVVVRTKLQRQVGGYDARLPHTGDQEMWMRLAANADVGFVHGVDQAYYRVHGQNMRTAFNSLLDLGQKRLAFDMVLDRYRASLSDPQRLSDIVHRKLSWQALWAAARAYDLGTTEQAPVDELVAFAFDCWPEADRFLPARFSCVSASGHVRCLPGAVHRVRPVHRHGWLQRRSWKYRGF